MTALIEPSVTDRIIAPVNRARLARYLELPTVHAIDPITDAEIAGLDDRRATLISPWERAIEVQIARIEDDLIHTEHGAVQATESYACQLRENDAKSLIIAALTIGGRVDDLIRDHLARQEVYEAFVLKQWAATMTEQSRVELTRRLHAQLGGERALLPYDGPGYNGWPLQSLHSLLEMLYPTGSARPIRVTESGVLLPTNSMVIVHGVVTSQRIVVPTHDKLAQCGRCAMRNCNYRMAGV